MQETLPATTPTADGQWVWLPYNEPPEFPWVPLIAVGIALPLLIAIIIWLIRFQRRAVTCARDGIELQREGIELVRRSQESSQRLIAIQEETNRLLVELNSRLADRRIE